MPVVRVNDVRVEVRSPATFERGTREHEEAAVLVGIRRVQRRPRV
jgi:hypothetical protein